MKMGAEPKKVGVFVALVAVAGIVYWINSSSDAPPAPGVARPAAAAAATATAPPVAEGVSGSGKKRVASGHVSLGEITYKVGNIDPGKVDPTLRLDLLAKVQSIEPEGGGRNLFQYCTTCPTEQEVAKNLGPIPKTDKIAVTGPQPTPPPTASIPQPPAAPPGLPPPPPINLKYYGYSTKRSDGEKKAFFLDGEDVIVAAEGEIIKKQYKVVRIGVNSVQMEDTASKSTQTLPIQQDAAPV